MKNFLRINALLLPGELGITTAIMITTYEFNPLLVFCWVGIWITVNFFITGGPKVKQERIENDRQEN